MKLRAWLRTKQDSPACSCPANRSPGWAARESPRVPGLREYITLFGGHCRKEVCSPELIERLLALQEKSHYIPFKDHGAALPENKNP